MKQRASLHRGKCGNAKHNEHNFKGKNKNVSICNFVNNETNLTKSEIEFYKENYSEMLEKQNAKYIERRQYKRCKTIEDLYNSKRYKPTEEILQWGNVKTKNLPDKETFNQMVLEYCQGKIKWAEEHGEHLHILNVECHFDEETPHAHIREIWDYEDENGIKKIDQERGMEASGLTLPKPDKKIGQYNNRCMTFTSISRTFWQDILEEHGYEVERNPLPTRRKNESIEQYHDRLDREYFEEYQDKIKTADEILKEFSVLTKKEYTKDNYKEISEDIKTLIKYTKGTLQEALKSMESIAKVNAKWQENYNKTQSRYNVFTEIDNALDESYDYDDR